MSKLGCFCGEIIRDQTNQLPYKGYLASDLTYFDAFDRASEDVASFIHARESGAERQWLSTYFDCQYPSLGPQDVVHDIFTRHLFPEHPDLSLIMRTRGSATSRKHNRHEHHKKQVRPEI